MREEKSWKGPLKLFLKLGVTALAFWWISGKISWADTIETIKKANFVWLFPALVFFNASKILSSFRLELFWQACGVRIDRIENLRLYYIGMFYNLFLPGGIGGDGYKVYLLSRKKEAKTKELVKAVLLDRISGLIPLGILTALLLCLPGIVSGPLLPWKWILLPLSAVGYLLAHILIKRFYAPFALPFHRASLQGMGVQILQLISAWFILLALGVEDRQGAFLALFLLSSVAAVIPFTIGGLGAREWVMVTGSAWLQTSTGQAVGTGLIFFVITALISLPGALLKTNLKP